MIIKTKNIKYRTGDMITYNMSDKYKPLSDKYKLSPKFIVLKQSIKIQIDDEIYYYYELYDLEFGCYTRHSVDYIDLYCERFH